MRVEKEQRDAKLRAKEDENSKLREQLVAVQNQRQVCVVHVFFYSVFFVLFCFVMKKERFYFFSFAFVFALSLCCRACCRQMFPCKTS